MITLAGASAYVGQMTAKQIASIVGKQASDRLWGARAANEALGKVPKPRPRRRLARWLKRPETLTDVLLAPERPGSEVVHEVDAVLSGSRRWRAIPADERLTRAEMVTVAVYDAVLSAHSASWSARISNARVMGALGGQSEALRLIGEGLEGMRAEVTAAVEEGTKERLDARLPLLPALTHQPLRRAWDDDAAGTWRLVTGLTDPSSNPRDVLAEWAGGLPSWAEHATPALLVAAAELAVAYGAAASARSLFLSAASAGAHGRQTLIARAAMLHDPGEESDALAVLAAVGGAVNIHRRL